MDPSQLASGTGEIRTNCTTRFGARHSMNSEGIFRHVTSVFIPYGNLIFSCFQTTKQLELQQPATTNFTPDYTYSQPDWSMMTHTPMDWNLTDFQMPMPQTPASLAYSNTSPYLDDRSSFSAPNYPMYPAAPAPVPTAKERAKSPPARRSSENAGVTRPLIKPPGDVQCCRICGLGESPEWRRSESGIKDLCNA